jgi:gluconate 2-dehydrogenase gamma chain
MSSQWSRREFLAGSGTFAAGSALRVGMPAILATAGAACTARDDGAAFEVLTSPEAREFEAIAARILPTTDTPGAREAGVIWFMDKGFGSIFRESLGFARSGLGEFQAGIADTYAGARTFSDLDEPDQDRWLATQEQTPFFGFVRFLTLAGFFGMSSHGGNRDNIGWQLLGFGTEHHQSWQPPFGYYDAEYMRSKQNGE